MEEGKRILLCQNGNGSWTAICTFVYSLILSYYTVHNIISIIAFIAAFSFVIDQGCYNLYLYKERQYIEEVCNNALQTACVVGQNQHYTGDSEYLNIYGTILAHKNV